MHAWNTGQVDVDVTILIQMARCLYSMEQVFHAFFTKWHNLNFMNIFIHHRIATIYLWRWVIYVCLHSVANEHQRVHPHNLQNGWLKAMNRRPTTIIINIGCVYCVCLQHKFHTGCFREESRKNCQITNSRLITQWLFDYLTCAYLSLQICTCVPEPVVRLCVLTHRTDWHISVSF